MSTKIPKNYKELPDYKNASRAEKVKMNRAYEEQTRAAETAKRNARALAKQAEFEQNRASLESTLMHKVMLLTAKVNVAADLSSKRYKSFEALRPSGFRQLSTEFKSILEAIALFQEDSDSETMTLGVTTEHLDDYYDSTVHPDAAGSPTKPYLFGAGAQDTLEAVDAALDGLLRHTQDKLDRFKSEIREMEEKERLRLARNKSRQELRASLPPEQAALVSPDE